MKLGLHHVLIAGGLLLGAAAGIFVIDSDPAIIGWIFGLGAGLAGGAFAAAIVSGEELAGGSSTKPAGRRRSNPALRHWDLPPSSNGTHEHSREERSRR